MGVGGWVGHKVALHCALVYIECKVTRDWAVPQGSHEEPAKRNLVAFDQ